MANEVKIVLSADGSGVKVVTGDVTQQFVKLGEAGKDAGTKASAGIDAVSERLDALRSSVTRVAGVLAGAFAVDKIYEYMKEMALLSARYETLGVAMTVVGKNAGYSGAQMEAAAEGMQHMGISMVESRQQAMRLVQAHIDLADSQKLARIAQDAAVIGNMNSSEAFAAMIHGISTAQPEVLRTIGLNVSMEQSYKVMAATLGKHVDALTQNEKTQGVLNSVMLAGADIAGTYEAAMDTAGKQINSMKRYTDDLKTVQGEVFNEVLTTAVMAYTAHLKDANQEMKDMAANGELKAWGLELAGMFVAVANAIDNMMTGVKKAGTWLAQRSVAGDIAQEYQSKIGAIPEGFGPQAMQRSTLIDQRDAAIKASMKLLDDSQVDLDSRTDRFQKAWDARQAAVADKAAKVLADTASKDAAYTTAMNAYSKQRQEGLLTEAQYVKTVQSVYQSMYGDNHVYRDTPATSPKKAVSTEYATLTRGIDASMGMAQAELDSGIKLSAADKYRTQTLDKLIAAYTEGKITLGQYIELESKMSDVENKMRVHDEAQVAQKSADKRAELRQKEADEIEKYLQQELQQRVAAEHAAIEAVKAIRKAQNSDIAGMGLGDAQRQRAAGIAQRETQFEKQPDQLAQALKDWDDYLAAKTAAEANWELGAKDGMANYLTDIGNTYKSASSMAVKAFKGMEDALVSFVTTGKLDFGSLADSIVSDMARIAIQQSITKPLATSFLGLFSANGNAFDSSGVQAFAKGGTFTNQIVDSPTLFKFASGTGMMGEAGPEAIMPLTRSANGKLGVQASGGGGGNNLVVNIIESPGNGGQQSRRTENGVDILDVFVEKVKSAIAGDIAQGSGAVPNAMAATYGLNRVAGVY